MRLIDADTIFNNELLLVRDECYDAVHAVIERINNAPTVDAEIVKHGHWKMMYDPFGFFDEIPVCSECEHTTKLREKYKYCPNCGAKMDEVENEID